jgi:hypothetical protein
VSPTTGRLGTVVVRAWVEPGRDVADVRARVLFVGGRAEEMTEVGVAAGHDHGLTHGVEALAAMSD